MREYITTAFLVLSILSGCTILEDRQSCPCLFSFHADSLREDQTILLYMDTGLQSLTPKALEDTITYAIPKFLNDSACFWSGNNPETFSGDTDFPEIYSSIIPLFTGNEEEIREVRFNKRYARIKCILPYTEEFDKVTIVYNNSGYNIRGTIMSGTSKIHKGISKEGDRNTFSITVPAQNDNRLTAYLTGRNSTTIEIGKILESAGYDWNATNLQDITITVDRSANGITVTVEGWDNNSMDITI